MVPLIKKNMGVDLIAAIGHRLSKAELLKLPVFIDQQTSLRDIKFLLGDPYLMQLKESKWNGDVEMTESVLEQIWDDWRLDTHLSNERIFDNIIDCFIVIIDVWRNTLLICHSPEHKYSNLQSPDKARVIFESNRCIARALGEDKILYFPDSAFPTSILLDKAQNGLTIEELIDFGIKEFGQPPEMLSDGAQFMFFIDHFQDLGGELKEWNFSEEKYWKYNELNKQYEKNNGT